MTTKIEIKPLHIAPSVNADHNKRLLDNALRGIDRGPWDDQTVSFLPKHLDKVILYTIVSWLERVRAAGMAEVLDLQIALQHRQEQAATTPPSSIE
jgi:hypothetical protein